MQPYWVQLHKFFSAFWLNPKSNSQINRASSNLFFLFSSIHFLPSVIFLMGYQFFLTGIDFVTCSNHPKWVSLSLSSINVTPNALNVFIVYSIFPNFTIYLCHRIISTLLTFWIHCVIIDQLSAPWVIVIQSLFCKSCCIRCSQSISETHFNYFTLFWALLKYFSLKKIEIILVISLDLIQVQVLALTILRYQILFLNQWEEYVSCYL